MKKKCRHARHKNNVKNCSNLGFILKYNSSLIYTVYFTVQTLSYIPGPSYLEEKSLKNLVAAFIFIPFKMAFLVLFIRLIFKIFRVGVGVRPKCRKYTRHLGIFSMSASVMGWRHSSSSTSAASRLFILLQSKNKIEKIRVPGPPGSAMISLSRIWIQQNLSTP